ncbi:MAG: T9SS type A sorting domain-containing protein [Melioribacteraceae bacterium]|nr:T9SS type A sorting domain-containing protein [Melioribacteraceae bacterium]MCF8355464.1 T9SS type A sorting domain-containing protein [Melioribacteraceae bacterium]MCF8392559.1 T9SS type A sorting domain-containing protein [Melioribacteraceae bacterium]MCF8418426.1 T9SS type A sorting domain-containing protein [Melioribacteraceae bacterium]
MSRLNLLSVIFLFLFVSLTLAQDYTRKEVTVPKVDPSAITLDGQMDEPEWQDGAQVNLVTATSYEMFALYYYRDGLTEPDFDEYYGRLLWTEDTLFVFMHIDEFVNDSTNLYWNGKWTGDQLFVSLSSRLSTNMMGWYDGNSYLAPEGPYHYWIFGDQVTLNGGDTSFIPEQYRGCYEDSLKAFDAADNVEWATFIDTTTGVWNIEMRIYNPHVEAQSAVGFNVGGSVGSRQTDEEFGDAYAYYTWQPNIPDDPFADPFGNGDPGYFNLANADYWAVLHFEEGDDDYSRKKVDVPAVQPGTITVDGVMDEAAWETAGEANLVTPTSYEMFALYYYRDGFSEPEYDEYYGRLLWTTDTLYLFLHIDEYVNDSTGLYWNGKWVGDQLFVSLSDRLARNMMGWYDGNSYAAPDGPYHFWILGDDITLNGGDTTYVPWEYRECFDFSDSLMTNPDPSEFARWATNINYETGVWDLEMAIYNPNVTSQSRLGFNIGGSNGSQQTDEEFGDAYGYYTWQPNIPDDPFGDPFGNGDPGFFNLANSEYWAVLNMVGTVTSVGEGLISDEVPTDFQLKQNYPNPFNPTTTIQFAVAEQSPISIRIYNTLGQLVETLINREDMSAGTYSINWDASRLASGVYFYTLETNKTLLSRKMILLK